MLIIDRRRRYRYFIFLVFGFGLLFFVNYNFLNSNESYQQIISNQIRLDCTDDPLKYWCEKQVNYCNSSLIIYNQLFARSQSVILQRKFLQGKRQGGEELKNVLNQIESDEYFQYEKGFLQFPCNISLPDDIFKKTHLSNIFSSVTSYKTYENLHIIKEITIAVNRYDYVNFYHTITDLYTVYLICRFFNYNPKSIHILFLDAHPKGNLDLLWSQLFHSYTRLGQINYPSLFYQELIWSPSQGKSELDISRLRKFAPSYFFNFREHILQQFQIDSERNQPIDCKNLNIFFLLRRNYVAHARNPTGQIQRQLINGDQIITELKQKFGNFSSVYLTSNYFEELSFQKQLETITQTDIFIGMHGAGLTHVIFMKSNRILIELATIDRQKQTHFEKLSSFNNISHHRCSIHNGNPSTTETIYNCITKNLFEICPSLSS